MLSGRVAIVTGGSRGIGRAIAQALAMDGANVAVIARSVEPVHAIAAGLPLGVPSQKHVGVGCDEIELALGPASVLINSAGISRDSLLLRAKDEDIMEQVNTNLLGTIFMSRAVLKSMLRNSGGSSIINIGSVVGVQGNAGQCVYSATKAALTGFSMSLAKEVGSRGVRVNVVAPGFIETDMTKGMLERGREKIIEATALRRLGTTDDVVQATRMLLQCEFITGQVIEVHGGLTL